MFTFMLPVFKARTSAAGLSIASNSLLITLKLVVGIAIGSVAVIAEGIHSALDLAAALIAFFSIRIAVRPADREHPFGHGKVEDVSAAIEAVLILFAAAMIVYEAVHHIIEGATMGFPDAGIAVMGVSAVVNFIVSRHLHAVARMTDSVALEADALHLTTDIVTSLGVMVGLVMIRVTGWHILDPVIAIGVALLICKAAYDLLRTCVGHLLDVRLAEDEEKIVVDAISEHLDEMLGFHDLRSRKAGSERHIDLHLVFPKNVTIEEAHALCNHLEEGIEARLTHSQITIHMEPCDEQCEECHITCDATGADAA